MCWLYSLLVLFSVFAAVCRAALGLFCVLGFALLCVNLLARVHTHIPTPLQANVDQGWFLKFKDRESCEAAAPCSVAAFHNANNPTLPLVPCNKSAPVSAPNCAYCCNFSATAGSTGVLMIACVCVCTPRLAECLDAVSARANTLLH